MLAGVREREQSRDISKIMCGNVIVGKLLLLQMVARRLPNNDVVNDDEVLFALIMR